MKTTIILLTFLICSCSKIRDNSLVIKDGSKWHTVMCDSFRTEKQIIIYYKNGHKTEDTVDLVCPNSIVIYKK